jgi:hypothetical protein
VRCDVTSCSVVNVCVVQRRSSTQMSELFIHLVSWWFVWYYLEEVKISSISIRTVCFNIPLMQELCPDLPVLDYVTHQIRARLNAEFSSWIFLIVQYDVMSFTMHVQLLSETLLQVYPFIRCHVLQESNLFGHPVTIWNPNDISFHSNPIYSKLRHKLVWCGQDSCDGLHGVIIHLGPWEVTVSCKEKDIPK